MHESPSKIEPENLCVLSYARTRKQPQGFTHWYYWLRGAAPQCVLADGFWNEASDLMRVGDVIFACGAGGVIQVAVVEVEQGPKEPGQVYGTAGKVRVKAMGEPVRP